MLIAIVTGASSGIGRELVLQIDKKYDFDEIWVLARRMDKLEELASSCRTPVKLIRADLSQDYIYDALTTSFKVTNPTIGLLVNAAGYGLFGHFDELDIKKQLGIIDINNKALTNLCYMCVPFMKRGSAIVNIGSNSAHQPVPYMSVYAASKAYVLSFSRALGKELKDKRIHVMCACPGWVKTEFFDTAITDDTIKQYGHFYTAKEVAKKILRDLSFRCKVSIPGFRVKLQVLAVKLLPKSLVMSIWCKRQEAPAEDQREKITKS